MVFFMQGALLPSTTNAASYEQAQGEWERYFKEYEVIMCKNSLC